MYLSRDKPNEKKNNPEHYPYVNLYLKLRVLSNLSQICKIEGNKKCKLP